MNAELQTRQELPTTIEEPENQHMTMRSDSASLMRIIEMKARGEDIDPQWLREMVQIKHEFEAEEARRDYAAAMARAQARIGSVVADAQNQQTNSRYSKLDTIVTAIKPLYTAEGFSVSFGTDEPTSEKLKQAGYIRCTSRCLHSSGHHEDYHVDLPADTAGAQGKVNKTVIHGTKSTITYSRGILLGLMFNFTSSLDVDDDGNAAGKKPKPEDEPATDEQLVYIKEFEDENKIPDEKLKWLNARRDNLTVGDAKRLLVYLRKLEKASAA